MTWDYPESPLGPADVLTGNTTYSQKGPTTFEAKTEAENSAGKFTITEVFEYQREAKTITRTITDSRGFTFTQKGTVAGDLGGQFIIRLDGEPFTAKGQQVRMNSVMRLLSPLQLPHAEQHLGGRRAVHQLRQSVVAQGGCLAMNRLLLATALRRLRRAAVGRSRPGAAPSTRCRSWPWPAAWPNSRPAPGS